MTKGGLATTIKTLLLRSNSVTPKGIVIRSMNKVARWDECYDDEVEERSSQHKVEPQDKIRKENEESCWIPHPRTGIYYPKGQEWVMRDVPVDAARFDYNYWFRNGDDDGYGV
ncbi:putative Late embryogenesis abundant protein, LEA_3 subgroup [Helianthus annuus]|uniref:Late embryogenesis abundant protein, LEA_3 subgroup n=1 Tax=Helianthus annuus TaxID=4232 RepID=A0A9K3DSU5_HELAN|nr:putative Late embryogenesis abundant protein, LEA_3 subgroup [Helianthus annuus]KAJ0438376.1 putative Late embryogenesis abundant protein, LEA_3 subgroup [Helianthus annuus]KAJ0460701.1 putative Late embryogenesis abundant protein, LEA_3 subgroup [Helianthus annuus]